MRRAVVIVAGGSGKRMESELPKQYIELDRKPIIIHTLEKFIEFDTQIKIVLVLAADHKPYWDKISPTIGFGGRLEVVTGGATRFDSVKNGLQIIEDGLIVGIHDAVRPLVSLEVLERCYNTAARVNSGIPVIELDETIRQVGEKGLSTHMDRSIFRRVQTPQVFKSEMIKEAYKQAYNQAFTDDASVFESLHRKVILVEGNRENIKITTPSDLQLAQVLIQTLG